MHEHPFPYLAAMAARYGTDNLQVSTLRQAALDALSIEDIQNLAETYREIEKRGDNPRLSAWIHSDTESVSQEKRRLFLLLLLFKGFAERGLQPFISRSVRLLEQEFQVDWTRLPVGLAYLAIPAEKYGRHQFPHSVDNFIERMTEEEREELRQLDGLTLRDEAAINNFLDMYPMTDYLESRLVYFMGTLIAILHDREIL
jgi:hypothetical protein